MPFLVCGRRKLKLQLVRASAVVKVTAETPVVSAQGIRQNSAELHSSLLPLLNLDFLPQCSLILGPTAHPGLAMRERTSSLLFRLSVTSPPCRIGVRCVLLQPDYKKHKMRLAFVNEEG